MALLAPGSVAVARFRQVGASLDSPLGRLRRISATRAWTLAIVAALLVATAALMRQLRFATFGEIDDHEIMDMLQGRSRLPLWRVPSEAVHGAAEPLGRFRPMYWVLRSLEAAVAGSHPTWWYVDRYLLCAGTVVALFIAARTVVPQIEAAGIALLPVLGPQFETWSRLGPNEAYAVPATAAAVAFAAVRWRRGCRRPAELWPAYTLLVVAGLCKENFLLLALIAVAASLVTIRRWTRRDYAVVAVVSVLTVAALAVTMWKVQHYGDIYDAHRTIGATRYRLWLMSSYEQRYGLWIVAAVMSIPLLVTAAGVQWRRIALAAVVVFMAVASQAYFYASAFDAGRYLYPVALVPAALFTLMFFAAHRSRFRRVAVLAPVLLALLLLPLSRGYSVDRGLTFVTVQQTRAFHGDIRTIEVAARRAGVRTVVLQSYLPNADYEPIASIAVYLHFGEQRLQAMVQPAPAAQTPFTRLLNGTLARWARDGGPDIVPFAQTPCVSVLFGPVPPVCPTTVSLTVRPAG